MSGMRVRRARDDCNAPVPHPAAFDFLDLFCYA
jgi:hypothetical protein